MYTYSHARQQPSALLKRAKKDGQVIIRKKDGQTFVVKAMKDIEKTVSPFAVKGMQLRMKRDEIVKFVHEGRKVV